MGSSRKDPKIGGMGPFPDGAPGCSAASAVVNEPQAHQAGLLYTTSQAAKTVVTVGPWEDRFSTGSARARSCFQSCNTPPQLMRRRKSNSLPLSRAGSG
jgi:hypothetical protein